MVNLPLNGVLRDAETFAQREKREAFTSSQQAQDFKLPGGGGH